MQMFSGVDVCRREWLNRCKLQVPLLPPSLLSLPPLLSLPSLSFLLLLLLLLLSPLSPQHENLLVALLLDGHPAPHTCGDRRRLLASGLGTPQRPWPTAWSRLE